MIFCLNFHADGQINMAFLKFIKIWLKFIVKNYKIFFEMKMETVEFHTKIRAIILKQRY